MNTRGKKPRSDGASRRSSDPAAAAVRALSRAIAGIQASGGTPDVENRKRAHELLDRLADVPVAMPVANNQGRYVDAHAAAVFLTG